MFIKDWLTGNNKQRVYQDLGIYPNPSLCPNTHLNIWKPFEMSLIEEYEDSPDELEIILNHIRILCDNNEEVYIYICKWIGQMLKHPEIKPGICPTFISQQGSGKGTLLTLLSKMMGGEKVFESTTPSRDVWGNFNGAMANSFLVNLNELSKIETVQSEGKIKALVTDSALTINNKGVNQFRITSYHRFLITTNNEDPITTRKDDRRNLIIRSSDEKRGDKEYFKQIHEYISDVNVVKTCYEYFFNLDNLQNFNKIPVPIVEYQQDMQDVAMCPIEKWIRDFTFIHKKSKIIHLTGKDSFDSFNTWCDDNKVVYNLTMCQFGLRLKRMNLKGLESKHTNKGIARVFNINKLKKDFNIQEPSLLNLMLDKDYDSDENY